MVIARFIKNVVERWFTLASTGGMWDQTLMFVSDIFICVLVCIGGSTLYIETSLKQTLGSGDSSKEGSSGSLQLTGHLGDVMKESAQIAYTVAKSFLSTFDPDNSFLQKAHLHLHVPEVTINYIVIAK